MSHWGYVIEALNNEDRAAAERRIHRRRRARDLESSQPRLAADRAERADARLQASPVAANAAKPEKPARRWAAVLKLGA